MSYILHNSLKSASLSSLKVNTAARRKKQAFFRARETVTENADNSN